MRIEGNFAVLDRAEARAELLTMFDDARDDAAMEGVIARLAPHERERFQRMIDESAEQAGVENGRISRHSFTNDATRLSESRKAKAADTAMMTALQLALADPAYRALYEDTGTLIANYESAAAIAMMEAELALDSAEEALAETMTQAVRLPDGRLVFRGENGEAVDIQGNALNAEDAESIVGLENAPLHSDYLARKKAVIDAEATIDAIRVYQVDTLGRARDRFEDQGNPPSANELRQIQDDIRDNAPAPVSAQIETPTIEAATPAAAPNFSATLNPQAA